MCIVDNFGVIGNSIGLFFGTPEMPKRLKIPVIHTYLNISRIQKIAFQAVAYT
jgi:hypothetical protein